MKRVHENCGGRLSTLYWRPRGAGWYVARREVALCSKCGVVITAPTGVVTPAWLRPKGERT